jgi:hypothetical protein
VPTKEEGKEDVFVPEDIDLGPLKIRVNGINRAVTIFSPAS